MSYTGAPWQQETIQKVMQELHDDRGVSDTQAVLEIENFNKLNNGKWTNISYKTYGRYRKSGIRDYKKGELLYEFFSRGPQRFRLISLALSGRRAGTEDQGFVDGLMKRFSSSDGGYRYDQIECMRHSYELYRRSWRVFDGKHFVRSLLRIDKEGGLYRLTEIQKFAVRGTNVYQVDLGWVFPYSTNFFAMANSSACMKFYDFHDLYPTPAEDGAVDEMRGNLIAVAGKGPHPSFRLFARRAKGREVEFGHYNVDTFSGSDDMKDILDYIMEKS